MQTLTDRVTKLVDVMFNEYYENRTSYNVWTHKEVLEKSGLENDKDNRILAAKIVGYAQDIEAKLDSVEVGNILKEAANNLFDDEHQDYYFSKVDFMLEEKMYQRPAAAANVKKPKLTI